MYKNQYLNDILENVKTKYSNEPEFIQAVEEFLDSMDFVVDKDSRIQDNAILERIIVPERIVTFRVPWVDDNGKINVNTGYRVQFNSAIGPYKGGLRFDKSVTLSIIKFLGFEQIFKNSLTGLPMGGGKGGSDFNPKGRSDAEIMRFCQSFAMELFRHVGPDTDVPAGDLGVGGREIGYIFGMYKKLRNEFTGTFTGKGLAFGGSLTRTEATGYGLVYYVEEMLRAFYNTDMKGKKVIISGTGNVATYAIEKAHQLGAIVLGCSNTKGMIYDPNGVDVPELLELLKAGKPDLNKYADKHPTCKRSANPKDIWLNPCDLALPCATQAEINLDAAKALKENGCYLVAEGANMPTDLVAVRYFNENGVLFAPGKASNAGGVAVSGLEMSQNAMHLSWTFDEVDARLKDIMKGIFKKCYDTAAKYGAPRNLALGANIAGFEKVYNAMLAEGII